MQFNIYGALASLLIISSLQATVIEMDEFYHPELNQTIILMHDAHFVLPDTDNKQIEDVMSAIRRLKAPLITEGILVENESRILVALANACEKGKLPVISAECRDWHYGYMIYELTNLLCSCKTYETIIAALTEENFGYSFFCAHKQNYTQLHNVIMPYVSSIPPLKKDIHVNQLYLEQFNILIDKIDSLLNAMDNWIYKFIAHTKSFKALATHLAKELILKKSDNTYSLNTQCLYQYMDIMTHTIFEINLLKELHQASNERVVFVHTGAYHLEKLHQYLPHIGFKLKNSISYSYIEKKKTIEAKLASQADFDKIAQSTEFKEFEECAVDIESFLKECKTLPSAAA